MLTEVYLKKTTHKQQTNKKPHKTQMDQFLFYSSSYIFFDLTCTEYLQGGV